MQSNNSNSGYFSAEKKALIQKDICTSMFTAALFIIAKKWKQCKDSSADEWILKCGTDIQWNITWP